MGNTVYTDEEQKVEKSSISVNDFYNHVTKYMTAEEALKTLLKSSLISYDNLKFKSKEESIHPLIIITMAALDLGWDLAVEKDQKEVRGLSVGTKEYLDNILSDHSLKS